jgi:H+/Cl- antiporter ClcA
MIIGVLGGLLGALFIKVNFLVSSYRKKYFSDKWKKVHEVVGLVLITCTVIYFAPMFLYNDCLDVEEGNIEA